MTEKFERQLPTGIGGEKLKEGRKTLPAVEVYNEVSWINNKMNLPFDLKIGEHSRLGMFLTPNSQTGESTYKLEVSGSHTRSGILGRVIFSDKEGRLYRDIDLKGIGFNNEGRQVGLVGTEGFGKGSMFGGFGGTSGIADQELIRRDISYSEKFLKAGIRTHRVIALLDLKDIIDDKGQKISIDEAKKMGILQRGDEPVIEVRAYGVRSRIWDVVSSDDLEAERLLLDAKNVVAQELNIEPEKFTYDDYFQWLIATTATNVARMHYNNWVNGYLTSHNLTLDGRIVDLDSVVTVAEAKKIEDDHVRSRKTFEGDCGEASDALTEVISSVRSREIYSGYYDMENSKVYFSKIYNNELERLKAEKVRRVRN